MIKKNADTDNVVITIRMDAEIVDEFNQRADSLYLSVSNYCKRILKEQLESDNPLPISKK
jgi:hypothetical protein